MTLDDERPTADVCTRACPRCRRPGLTWSPNGPACQSCGRLGLWAVVAADGRLLGAAEVATGGRLLDELLWRREAAA